MVLNILRLKSTDCRIVLITTDSAEGVFAARLNKRIIAHRLLDCPENVARHWKSRSDDRLHEQSLGRLPIVRVPGLQVQDATRFHTQGRKAFEQMMQDIYAPMTAGEKVLNITGGFKGVIPIAVWWAWHHNWNVAYLYEETDRLLTIRRPKRSDSAPPSEYSSPEVTLFGGISDQGKA